MPALNIQRRTYQKSPRNNGKERELDTDIFEHVRFLFVHSRIVLCVHHDAALLLLCGCSWNQHEALQSLIRKAGYDGPIQDELLARIRCTRYQSSKCRVTYQEYVNHVDLDPSLLLSAPDTKRRWCLTS
jgi:hypothetical protein